MQEIIQKLLRENNSQEQILQTLLENHIDIIKYESNFTFYISIFGLIMIFTAWLMQLMSIVFDMKFMTKVEFNYSILQQLFMTMFAVVFVLFLSPIVACSYNIKDYAKEQIKFAIKDRDDAHRLLFGENIKN